MSEMLASETPEQRREDRHRHEPGQLKSQQLASEKCVIGRAGRAPCSMRTFVVNEMVASETPEQSMLLKCWPVKRESNTQASVIEPRAQTTCIVYKSECNREGHKNIHFSNKCFDDALVFHWLSFQRTHVAPLQRQHVFSNF